MAIGKTEVFTGSGEITPEVEGFTPVTIDDPILGPKTLVVEGLAADEALNLVAENYSGDGWEPVHDGSRVIQFNRNRKTVLLTEHGVYGVTGNVDSTVIIYTRETA